MVAISIILGILSLIGGLIPVIGWLFIPLALIGLTAGGIALIKRIRVKEPCKWSVTGILCNITALCFIAVWTFVLYKSVDWVQSSLVGTDLAELLPVILTVLHWLHGIPV